MWRRLMAFAEDIEDRIQCALLRRATSPKGTEKYFGCSSGGLAHVTRNFSALSGVLGGKNSMLKFFREI